MFIIAALSAATFVATPVLAEDHVWQTGSDFTVRANDLDLSRAGDRALLLRRVEFASARLCGNHHSRRQRGYCTADVLQHAMSTAPAALRTVLANALNERGGVAMASR
jgi:UrcA family protein